MATSNGIFGLTALTEALNAPAEESSDIFSLMEELADDSIKQLVLDREVAGKIILKFRNLSKPFRNRKRQMTFTGKQISKKELLSH